jgi:hypothetical protein
MRAKEFLSEGLQQDKAEQLIHEFVKFAAESLELDQLPEIELQRDNKRSVHNKSFGGYGGHHINVTMTNRHIMDVCRTLAHELVHYRQDLRGELNGENPGATGSPQENEANAQAAVIMRNWGKLHPDMFAQESIE